MKFEESLSCLIAYATKVEEMFTLSWTATVLSVFVKGRKKGV